MDSELTDYKRLLDILKPVQMGRFLFKDCRKNKFMFGEVFWLQM
jgi:hypothetical protein